MIGKGEPTYEQMASRIREMFSSKDDTDYPSNYHQQSRMITTRNGHSIPVLELKVPMCCEKCQEKVKENLLELEGVKDVVCDQYNQRVTVTGFVDPLKALRKVKKVKKKSEFFNTGSYINGSTHPIVVDRSNEVRYTTKPFVRTNSFGRFAHEGQMPLQPRQLVRTNSYGRRLGRQPSFGRVDRYDGRQYNDLAPTNLQRDFYGIRRMPSFKNHRHHDAEYISMGDEFRPSFSETHYVPYRNQQAVYRSQVSFSKLPVTNPYYMQHIDSEYY